MTEIKRNSIKKIKHLLPDFKYYVDPFCGGLGFLQSMLDDNIEIRKNLYK